MGNFKHLGRRFLVTLFGIPLLLCSMIVGKLFFLAITGLIVTVALWELYALAEKKGHHPLKIVGIVSAMAIAADFYFWNAHWFQWILFLEWFIVLTVGLFQTGKNHLANAAVTLGGTIYLSCFSFFLLLRQLPVYTDQPYEKGGLFIMMVFVSIWICDTAAYFVGSSLGKRPLFPRVSPRKTWEGAIAGFIFSPLSVWAFDRLFMKSLSLADILFVGFVIGTVGQMSDLIESLFKRDVDVKDSSNLLPGHGGMLDRFDSPLLVAPLLYFYLFLKYFLL